MKRLYLLRHAHALNTAESDKERELSDNGKGQSEALHALTVAKNYIPSLIACSPATRTRQTCGIVFPNREDVVFPDNFYNAAPGILLSFIQDVDDAHDSLAIVNHNPTIQQLAFSLCGEAPEELFQSLSMGYAPCTLAVYDCPVERWADITPGINTLSDLIPS